MGSVLKRVVAVALLGPLVVAAVWAAIWFSTGWVALLTTLVLALGVGLISRRAPEARLRGPLILGTAIAWLPILGLMLLLPGGCADEFPLPFNASLWRVSPVRQLMVDSLVESDRLAGMTRSEVHLLLGEPSDPGGVDLWRMGPDRGIGIDSEWLAIRFGPQDRVLYWYISVD
jgi:hypothetical protein